MENNAEASKYWDQIKDYKIFAQNQHNVHKHMEARNRREQIEEEKKENMNRHKVRWQVFRKERDQVIKEYVKAKKKSVRARNMLIHAITVLILRVDFKKFHMLKEKRIMAAKAAWAHLKLTWAFRRMVKRRYTKYVKNQDVRH